MTKNDLRSADLFIIVTVGIQAAVFLLNYETNLLYTIFSSIQLVLLISYLIYSIRLRHYFESTVNQEDNFYDRQFDEIKHKLGDKKLKMSYFLNQKNSVDTIQNMFKHSRMIYTEKIKTDKDHSLTVDMLMVTENGIFVIQFYNSRFILQGDYQVDMIQLQYSDTQIIEMVNPLSDLHPLVAYIHQSLNVNYADIKRVLIINDKSYVSGMDTLKSNQDIIKFKDVGVQLKKMIDKSDVLYSVKEIDALNKILEERIID